VEIVRLLEEWRGWHSAVAPPPPGSAMWSPVTEYEVSVIDEVIKILKGYLRVLIMLQQFRVAFLAFFTHYPELFGEQDGDGPFD
jgi:hypothetical protein